MPLHPFSLALLERMKGLPALSSGTPQAARAMVAAGRAALGEPVAVAAVEDIALPTRAGTIRARTYRPDGAVVGKIVYLHGGGWVIGAIEDFDVLARKLAAESGCAVVLPDYRLAPEHPFPAGLEDGEDALLWARDAWHPVPGAPLPLVVAGDSAGANLATVAARRVSGRIALAAQALIYPVTDCAFDTPSYAAYGTGYTLTRADMDWFFGHYGAPDPAHPDVAPLRAPDLAGLPPTFLVAAEYDVLASEGAAYAERLRRSGVPVEERLVEGLMHGCIRLHNHIDLANGALVWLAGRIAASCRSL